MNKREFARSLRRNQTDAERKLWFFLKDRRLTDAKFRRQHPVGEYIADFCCVERNLVVELDGGQHAMQGEADAARTVSLEGHGYRVLRFWDNDVLKNTEGVLEVIRKELGVPSPRPSPPHGGEGDVRVPSPRPSPPRGGEGDIHIPRPACGEREIFAYPRPACGERAG